MKQLQYYINDVREASDNEDTNGVSDKEIIRYFNDFVKSVQALIYKNNPLCSYFQVPTTFNGPVAGTAQDLPTNCYAENSVSFVEVKAESTAADLWSPLERCWQEDQNSFIGWYTRRKQVVFSGYTGVQIGTAARVWYFMRLPKWDKPWARVTSVVGQVVNITVLDTMFSQVDDRCCFVTPAGVARASNLTYVVTSGTSITVTGDLTGVVANDLLLMGPSSLPTIDLPDECETYCLDYVANRIYSRNNYAKEGAQILSLKAEAQADLIAIFGDIGQSQQRAPITDTSYLRI